MNPNDTTDDRTMPQTAGERARARDKSKQSAGPPGHVPGVELEHRLGEGAYGEVWVGVSHKTGRRVAVKFYAHRGGLDWTLLAREVETLSFLFGNRYVVQLLDVGWDAKPPYYVMEYMPQGSLEDLLAHGPLPVDRMLSLFRDVMTGLIHAHGKGVLHCDLKPANVLIGVDGKPRLADFGQSRLTTEQQPALGTLFYMAPEQADLNAVPDVRWDVYALGALAYRMLTGVAPFRTTAATDEIDRAGSLEQRLRRYREVLRAGPRPRAHRKVPGVDRMLADIIQRCLAADPSRRFANVQALSDALDARRQRLARRPLLVLGALGPALLLIVLTWFAWAGYSAAIGESQRAVVGRVLESNRFAAQFVAEAVAQQIDQRWRVLEVEAGKPGFAQLVLDAADEERTSEARKELQRRIEAMKKRHRQLSSTSWFVDSHNGRQIARSPFNETTIDQSYAFRDYFHGQGRDLPPDTEGLEPIRRPHRSNVFTSQATGNRMVAFSVPIYPSDASDDEADPIGVLAMTVELGKFAELRPEDRTSGSQIAVLVDRRPDAQGRPGAVLEHPYMAGLLAQGRKPPAAYLENPLVALLGELSPLMSASPSNERAELPGSQRLGPLADDDTTSSIVDSVTIAAPSSPTDRRPGDRSQQLNDLKSLANYHDPLREHEAFYAGRWLAAVDPVLVTGRDPDLRDTGWAVIVQERYENAIQPVRKLGIRLLRQWLIALGAVAAVITALWGIVALLLNETRRWPVLSNLRRKLGLQNSASLEPPSTTSLSNRDPVT